MIVLAALCLCGVAVQGPDTIRAGHPALTGVALGPGVDTVDSWKIEEGVRTPLSTSVRTVTAIPGGWRIVVDHRSAAGGDRTVDTTDVARSGLHLLRRAVWATTDSAVVTYRDGTIRGWAVPPGESRRAIQVRSGPVLPDDGIEPWIFALLPLRDGYEAVVETFGTWDGALSAVTYRVTGTGEVEWHHTVRPVWVVRTDRLERFGLHAEARVDRESRRVLRSRAWTDDGVEYISATR